MSQVKEKNFSWRLLFQGLLDNEENKDISIDDIIKQELGNTKKMEKEVGNDHIISLKDDINIVGKQKVDERKANLDAKAKLKGRQIEDSQRGK